MNMHTTLRTLVLACALTSGSALAGQNTSANVFDSRSALASQQAEIATVVAIRPVQIKDTGTNKGTYLGGAVGGATGYALTRNASSSMRGVGSILGLAGGAAVGQAVGNRVGSHPAVQIFVQRYDHQGRPSGSLTSVVEDDDQGIRTGDRVLLVRSRQGFSIVRTEGTGMGEAPTADAQEIR
jgi:outer membrane lipoprotein SlyB